MAEKVLDLAQKIRDEFPRSVFFLGQPHDRILHHETALAIQKRLQFAGLEAVVLPIRVRGRRLRRAA